MAIDAPSAETTRQERAQSGETGIGHSGDPALTGGNRPQAASIAPGANMAPQPSAPPGLQQDNRGNAIPFEERTEEDQKLARSGPEQLDK